MGTQERGIEALIHLDLYFDRGVTPHIPRVHTEVHDIADIPTNE